MKKIKLISLAISFSAIFSNYCFAMKPSINSKNNLNKKNVQFNNIKNNNYSDEEEIDDKKKNKKSNLNLSNNKFIEEEFFESDYNMNINAIRKLKKNKNNSNILLENESYIEYNKEYASDMSKKSMAVAADLMKIQKLINIQNDLIDNANKTIDSCAVLNKNGEEKANNFSLKTTLDSIEAVNKKIKQITNRTDIIVAEIKKHAEFIKNNNNSMKENNKVMDENIQQQRDKYLKLIDVLGYLFNNNENEENKKENDNQINIYENDEEDKKENDNRINIYEYENDEEDKKENAMQPNINRNNDQKDDEDDDNKDFYKNEEEI